MPDASADRCPDCISALLIEQRRRAEPDLPARCPSSRCAALSAEGWRLNSDA